MVQHATSGTISRLPSASGCVHSLDGLLDGLDDPGAAGIDESIPNNEQCILVNGEEGKCGSR